MILRDTIDFLCVMYSRFVVSRTWEHYWIDSTPLIHQTSHPLMHIITHEQITLQQRRDKKMSILPDKTSAVHNEEYDNQPGPPSTTHSSRDTSKTKRFEFDKVLIYGVWYFATERSKVGVGVGIRSLVQKYFSSTQLSVLHGFILLQWLCSISIYYTVCSHLLINMTIKKKVDWWGNLFCMYLMVWSETREEQDVLFSITSSDFLSR